MRETWTNDPSIQSKNVFIYLLPTYMTYVCPILFNDTMDFA